VTGLHYYLHGHTIHSGLPAAEGHVFDEQINKEDERGDEVEDSGGDEGSLHAVDFLSAGCVGARETTCDAKLVDVESECDHQHGGGGEKKECDDECHDSGAEGKEVKHDGKNSGGGGSVSDSGVASGPPWDFEGAGGVGVQSVVGASSEAVAGVDLLRSFVDEDDEDYLDDDDGQKEQKKETSGDLPDKANVLLNHRTGNAFLGDLPLAVQLLFLPTSRSESPVAGLSIVNKENGNEDSEKSNACVESDGRDGVSGSVAACEFVADFDSLETGLREGQPERDPRQNGGSEDDECEEGGTTQTDFGSGACEKY